MKQKQTDSNLKCCFGFPLNPCDTTRLEFEPINIKDGTVKFRAKIITKRNDPRLNTHQHLQLQGQRANCDIQIIIDYHACVEYMTKYASKSEPRSPALKHTLNCLMQQSTPETSPTRLMRKLMLKTLDTRDFSAQETMHHLLSLKLYSSTFSVIPISLDGSRKVKTIAFDDTEVSTHDSLLDAYENRKHYLHQYPDLLNINFTEFACKYRLSSHKLSFRTKILFQETGGENPAIGQFLRGSLP